MKKYKKAKDIKVGVIGYGGAFNMGRHHLTEMKTAGMTPTAVMELDKSRLSVADEDFPGIETYSSLKEMLKKSEVDLITIITPHNTHHKLAMTCLNAGRHVVCEKPLAITTAECDQMISTAKKKRVMLSTYHNRHWDPIAMQAVKLVKSGKVGEVIKVTCHAGGRGQPGDWWRSSKSISGGVAYDWGVHCLEYALQLVKGKMTEVSAYGKKGFWKTKWKNDTNEDELNIMVRFDSGMWIDHTSTSIDTNNSKNFLEVTGTKGSIVLSHFNWELLQKNGDELVKTSGNNPAAQWEKFYKNIAGHLVRGDKLVITPEWARRPIHILDLADQSFKKKRSLPAKYA